MHGKKRIEYGKDREDKSFSRNSRHKRDRICKYRGSYNDLEKAKQCHAGFNASKLKTDEIKDSDKFSVNKRLIVIEPYMPLHCLNILPSEIIRHCSGIICKKYRDTTDKYENKTYKEYASGLDDPPAITVFTGSIKLIQKHECGICDHCHGNHYKERSKEYLKLPADTGKSHVVFFKLETKYKRKTDEKSVDQRKNRRT